ncbi:uncharacterized protein LOC120637190 [Pararge aegeria]|uniref:uncharacterized protein LOC120624143 n=1 Tax=Pararge aegeria TaxID=116150 RepID=UPI0019D09E47|nr:uncharacterized protein LOC120624143 [Pararge aegeria]XP_039756769.1 uncharacterized protein LOC120631339 [Pararge aegeria]XP_039761664.1 uncharacterized protein LOC120634880 [Pararge aegeria]XP_039764340.1 uncharacterized protein LOC120636844 [Pararge aegeria]XP_039764826.1 uncharacterized protein LOC120637190 [Pararge aegeria]
MDNLHSIEHSISALTEHFNARMADFQRIIQTSIPATSPSSNVAAQFAAFRVFVLTSLESLQLQVQVLSKQYDIMETRSRRKMLLVHGVSEVQKENVSSAVMKVLSSHLGLPELTVSKLSYCKRLGQPKDGKARAILIKFSDLSVRNEVWSLKTRLKGTGVTISEFLTKERHDAFQAARQKFGVSQCWTRDGTIIVLGSDGKRHRVFTVADVKVIISKLDNVSMPTTSATADQASAVAGHSSVVHSNSAVPAPRSTRPQAEKARRAVRK